MHLPYRYFLLVLPPVREGSKATKNGTHPNYKIFVVSGYHLPVNKRNFFMLWFFFKTGVVKKIDNVRLLRTNRHLCLRSSGL